jgi:hypothetical protein
MKCAWTSKGLLRFLVVAPSLAGSTVWPDTIAAEWPEANVTLIAGGSVARRANWLGALRLMDSSRPDVVIVNPEAVAPLEAALKAWGPQAIVVDEMHLIRSAGAKRSKALARLGDKASWKRGLTGTVTPKDFSNLYSQYRFLAPDIFGTNQAQFRKRYIVPDARWPNKVVGYLHLPELQYKMHSIASVIKRKDVFGADGVQPPVIQSIPLPAPARTAYDKLAKEYVLEAEGLEGTEAISHKLSRLGVLAQLASGFVYDDDHKARWIHDAKINGLMEELTEYFANDKPAVIFYRFDAEGVRIKHEIEKVLHGKVGVALLSGSVPLSQRLEALNRFASVGGPRYLIMQEQVGSLGISLARASTCIFFSHGFDYATHTQARDRIWKPGPEPLLYVYLRAKDTVDYFAGRIIDAKAQASNMLLRPGSFAEAAYGR